MRNHAHELRIWYDGFLAGSVLTIIAAAIAYLLISTCACDNRYILRPIFKSATPSG